MAKDLSMFGPTGTKTKPAVSPGALSALEKAIAHGSDLSASLEKKVASLETPKKVSPAAVHKAPEGFFFLSEMTDGRLPRSGKDHLFPRYPEDHWAEEFRGDIPEVDPFYCWDADVAEALYVALKRNEKALLHGLPGTGKTTAVHQLAAWIRQPYAKFGGKSTIEPSAFLGQSWATHEIVMEAGVEKVVPTMVFKEGLLPPAVRNGYMTTIDEFCKLSPDVQMACQSLYEKGGHLMLDEKPGTIAEKKVHPAPEFRLFVTDNTLGLGDNMHMFAASQVQDTSTLDRFTITIPVNYMNQNAEVEMLSRRYPKLDKLILAKIVKFAGLVRHSYKVSDLPVTLSPRGLCTICEILDEGLSLETATNLAYTNKLSEDTHRQLVSEQLRTVA